MKLATDHSECFDARLDSIVYSPRWAMSTKLDLRVVVHPKCGTRILRVIHGRDARATPQTAPLLVLRWWVSFATHAHHAGASMDLTCVGSLHSGASHIHKSRIILKAGRICRCIWLAVSLIALSGGAVANVSAQQTSANIRLAPDSDRVIVEGNSAPATVWSFLDSYASVVGLANRIERFTLFDEGGNEIQVRKIAPGQFDSPRSAARFRYEVSLKPPALAMDSAMVSWLNQEHGLLMPADLLPVSLNKNGGSSAIIRFTLPDRWRVYSSEVERNQNEFEVRDAGQAVFAVGARLRAPQISESGMLFSLVTDGDWAFADREALELAGKVLKAHREVFGAMPAKQGILILFPFPQAIGPNQWSAETRRSTVTLLMGKLPSKVGALAQLSTPVTHEFFHLWVPNALALDGDYDWFYEGFTIYQAAQTAVRLGLLTFPEFLNSIARAYDSSKSEAAEWSLIEASTRRFTIGRTSVYSKSQVVAFLYDLRLRSLSHNKKSLADVYRKLIREHRAIGDYSRGAKTNNGIDVVTSELSAEIG